MIKKIQNQQMQWPGVLGAGVAAVAAVALVLNVGAGGAAAQGPGKGGSSAAPRIGRMAPPPSHDAVQQLKKRSRIVVATAKIAPASLKPGQRAQMIVQVKVAPGYHIYGSKPGDPYVIPTALSVSNAGMAAVKIGKPVYPVANGSIASPEGKGRIAVYTGDVTLKVPVVITAGAKPGTAIVTGTLRAQACNDSMCLPPANLFVSAPLTIVR